MLLNPHNANTESTGLDSVRFSRVGQKGDLIVELHFIGPKVTTAEASERQAALYVCRQRAQKDGIYIPFREMWAYAQAGGLPHLVAPLADKLYGFATKDDHFRLIDVIMDYLEDLKNHPIEVTGVNDSLDEFLADCEERDAEFFVEINGERISL